jgi:Zn-finger nucleic acid-binding protein
MSLSCPKCSGAMEEITLGETAVDRCTRCGGMWFDLMEQHRLRAMSGAEKLDTGSAERGRKMNEQTKLKCPRCHNPMSHQRDTDHREIEYEYCSVCNGSFFDAGEFKQYAHHTVLERIGAKLRGSKSDG